MTETPTEIGSAQPEPSIAPETPSVPIASPTTHPTDDVSFARLIGSATGIKLVVDTSVQVFNPFLSIIAEGLGTTVVVLGRMISLRSLMGLFSPLFGALADRAGYRRTLRLSLWLVGVGILLVGFSPVLWVAVLGMAIMGLGTGSFVPIMQAYLSSRLPYARRARGLGIVEYSWAIAGMIGLPLMGLLIARAGWRAPLVLLGVLLLVAGWLALYLPPSYHVTGVVAHPHAPASRPSSLVQRARAYFTLSHNARSAYSTIAAGALNYFGAMQLMLIYGTWLSDAFGLGPGALGTVAFVLGIGDLLASIAVSIFTDRFGKKRSVILGVVIAVTGYLLLPRMAATLATAVAGIMIARSGFEFAIVSHFPLLSEQVPDQRSKVMSLGSAIALTVATAGGFTSPWLYTQVGIGGVTALSAAASGVALLILVTLVRDRPA